jgi:hypothetical protein
MSFDLVFKKLLIMLSPTYSPRIFMATVLFSLTAKSNGYFNQYILKLNSKREKIYVKFENKYRLIFFILPRRIGSVSTIYNSL